MKTPSAVFTFLKTKTPEGFAYTCKYVTILGDGKHYTGQFNKVPPRAGHDFFQGRYLRKDDRPFAWFMIADHFRDIWSRPTIDNSPELLEFLNSDAKLFATEI